MDQIKYEEGQWFAVPLRNDGYAVGVIVRGNHRTKGGLGYFFGPMYQELPGENSTIDKNPNDAILITRFGDLGIITGSWPLIKSSRIFLREEWPIPKFGLKDFLVPDRGFIRDYLVTKRGKWVLVKESIVKIEEIKNLPEDGDMGGGAVEIRLTKILDLIGLYN